MSEPVASFHLVRQHGARAPAALARLALDRRPLARAGGLRFARLLGTGRGSMTSLSADLMRTALFAVWDSDDALDAFMRSSNVVARWRGTAAEHYSCRLRYLSGGGRWKGIEPLAAMTSRPTADSAPVAVVTRANVRARAWARFIGAGRDVSDAVRRADGLVAVVGIGEAPLGRQGTFSVWRDAAAVDAFARGTTEHVNVVKRTRAEGWYGDELFARFAPTTIEGTWDGIDPLAPPA